MRSKLWIEIWLLKLPETCKHACKSAIPREQPHPSRAFGKEYEDYMGTVDQLVPLKNLEAQRKRFFMSKISTNPAEGKARQNESEASHHRCVT
jgi:hypothetical protein